MLNILGESSTAWLLLAAKEEAKCAPVKGSFFYFGLFQQAEVIFFPVGKFQSGRGIKN